MATTSTSARFTRSWALSNARGTPNRLLAASADSRRLVDSAVISKSSGSDCKAGMCACTAHPRSGLAPMMPTRILLAEPLFTFMFFSFSAIASTLRPGQSPGPARFLRIVPVGARLECREVFEVGPHREQHLRTYRRHMHL